MSPLCPRCATRLDSRVQGLCARCLLEMALSDQASDEDPPFRIVTLLGQGPRGTTYLAEQEDDPRFVSLKVLDASDASAARDRLAAVRRTLLDCRHASLVRVVSVVLTPTPTIAAAYVQGKRASAGSHEAKTGLIDAAEAIAYLHQRRLIHGNIRASNVLVLPPEGPSGRSRWCVIDLAASAPLTSTSDVAIDLAAFGQLMVDVLGPRDDQPAAIRAIIDRACRAGLAGGYHSASDLLHDLRQ